MRQIQIDGCLNGWIVKVGCRTVVFTDKVKLVGDLLRYLENPQTVEDEYQKAAVNDCIPEPANQACVCEQDRPQTNAAGMRR